MSAGEQTHKYRVNGSTTESSKHWRDSLGIEDSETLVENLRRGITTESQAARESVPEQVALDRLQVLELCQTSLDFLAGMAMPTVFKHFFPPTHLTAWQILVEAEREGSTFPQIALGIPRGHAKTTLIKLFILWVILFTKRKFILIAATTEMHATNILADVMNMLNEPNIRGTFGDWRLGEETDTKQMKNFGFRGRNITLIAVGAGGAVRGFNVNNERPDVMVFDDIQTKECAESELMSTALESWMVGTAMKAKSPSGCMFIFAGNMFPTQWSILKKLKTNGTWTKFISGAILADGTALWPELRSIESLLEEFDNDIAIGHPEIFFSEVLNDTEAGMNTNVDFSKFAAWEWTKDDLPQAKFLIIDPSTGKGKDSDVIGRFEVYDEQLGCRELVEEKLSPSNLIKRALIMAVVHNIHLIAIEAMAYQFTLLHWFDETCKTYGITGIQCVPLYATNHSKNSRISAGLKALQSSDIILHASVRAKVQTQIANWNPMKKNNVDDILDVVSYAPKVVAEYAYDIMTKTNLVVIDADGAQVRDDNHSF